MATPFYLRSGVGDFNYLNHDPRNDTYLYAGHGYERPGVNTCIHTWKEWKTLFPEAYRFGKLERVKGRTASKWRKSREQSKRTLSRPISLIRLS